MFLCTLLHIGSNYAVGWTDTRYFWSTFSHTRYILFLKQLVKERGCPMVLRTDPGLEFSRVALLQWEANHRLHNRLIGPGKSWQNGTAESFNGKFTDECLAMNLFYSRAHVKVIIETWRKHHKALRLHSSREYKTPLEFASQWKSESTTGARGYR